ncbi:hypothetical protein V0M98_32240 (plasmid) [Pseudomonas silesiensis]|uniref:hypothetical protein n=1 Tax=Pseudomonas silesiensis TaxID=1853130 RepID=UPI0030D04FDC
MEIPKSHYPPLFSEANTEQKKELADSLLKQMGEEVGEAIEPEPNFEAVRSRFRMSVNLVFISVIIGTAFLLLGSLNYASIPDPLIYVTTQDGRISEITPIHQE